MSGRVCAATLPQARAAALTAARDELSRLAHPVRRADCVAILRVIIEDHGHDPDRRFPLTRERMGTWPTRRYDTARRRQGIPAPRDPFDGNAKVARLRERLGHIPMHRIKEALTALRNLGILVCEAFGYLRDTSKRPTRLANAWSFGQALRRCLSAAHKTQKPETEDQNLTLTLSGFLTRGLGRILGREAFTAWCRRQSAQPEADGLPDPQPVVRATAAAVAARVAPPVDLSRDRPSPAEQAQARRDLERLGRERRAQSLGPWSPPPSAPTLEFDRRMSALNALVRRTADERGGRT